MADAPRTFTGERLSDDDALFGVDLLRHRAAYAEAARRAEAAGATRILELGSGTGYGARALAHTFPGLVAVDRVAPHPAKRGRGVHFVRGDLDAFPICEGRFDVALSFQVVEHLPDPTAWLDALAGSLADGGLALVTTPNADFSDGENPFHVHEYRADELAELLCDRFESVEMLGVSARGEALAYHEARLARIRRIVGLDVLGLRRRLPRPLVEWLFGRLAILVRRWIGAEATSPRVTLEDFPIERAHARSLDLFAICRGPRPAREESRTA